MVDQFYSALNSNPLPLRRRSEQRPREHRGSARSSASERWRGWPESNRLKKFGSPSLSEIELGGTLANEWNDVVKWLCNLDLLRAAGLEQVMLRL